MSTSEKWLQNPSAAAVPGDGDNVAVPVGAQAQCMLESLGDAIISTDLGHRVTYLNAVAEALTGWGRQDAIGRSIGEVFHLIDADTREPAHSPVAQAIQTNSTLGLASSCLLVRPDGTESAIEDSTAPIRDGAGRVSGAVMVFRNVTDARAQLTHLSHLAHHDGLTGLVNRTLFDERFTQALKLARRRKQQIGVLLVDLDNFKDVNDTRGHQAGDQVLQLMARRMQDCVRESDTVCRFGGDEFAVLLSEMTQERDAALCAEKVLAAIGASHRIDGHDLRLTASIGIATCPNDGTDARTLIRHADSALYLAKAKGRNNFKFFGRDMNLRAEERQATVERLHQGLARGEFFLQYQPIFDIPNRMVSGVEALIRWRDPRHGITLPEHFVPLTEECGLIVPIGQWVLEEACRQCRQWQRSTLPAIRIAVNVSAVELGHQDYVAGVKAILANTGLDPRHLVLELTESVLVTDASSTTAVLSALKDLGIGLALDDFGTGYSSLSHLKQFPIDMLKIDKSFIRDVTTDPVDAGIVGAIIGMAESLQRRVVAEGVETAEQFVFLQEQSCPEAQGNYLGEPADATSITELQWQGRWNPASDPLADRQGQKPSQSKSW